ncbi:MAG: serine/threonine protein kinase [Verrucomicrobiales bacterium]|jgi:serine/threonine protein kinase
MVDVTQQEPLEKIQCSHCGESMRVRSNFDHFQLIEQIGQGGMSRVFRAHDTLLHRDVALKILSHECGNESERFIQFEREARLTASFSHPNVVKVFSVGKDQGYYYIAMELVSYSSFEDVISRRGKVSESEVLNIGLAVTQGLLAAQSAGLIHRDIKPGNILFAEDGTAKLVDFGLAIVVERDVDYSGEIWATPYYVAPEKLNGEAEDFRSDLYSLGATLYHALAGVPPIEVSTTSIDELRRMKAEAVDIGRVVPELGAPSAALINRMLALRPDDRFDSYEQLSQALQAAKQGKGFSPSAGRVRGKGKRSVLFGSAAAGVVAIVVAMGIYFAMSYNSRSVRNGTVDLLLDETTSGAGYSSQTFLRGRQFLVRGELEKAAKDFEMVAGNANAQQPTINWALFNLGLIHLLRFDQESAVMVFQEIVSRGVYSNDREDLELVSFFLDVAKLVQSRDPVSSDQKRAFNKKGYHSVGLLALGLRRWGMGDLETGSGLLQEFRTAAAMIENPDWIATYVQLTDGFLADATVMKALLPEPGIEASDEVAGLERYVVAAEKALAVLMLTNGPHFEQLQNRLQSARQRVAEFESWSGEQFAMSAENLSLDHDAISRELTSTITLREHLEFRQSAERMQALNLRTPSAAAERDAWVQILLDADALLVDLGRARLPEGFSGTVLVRDGAPIRDVSFQLDPEGIRINTNDQKVSFRQCTPGFLLLLGESLLESMSDSDDYIELVTRMAAFARANGLQDTVPDHLELLAAVWTSTAEADEGDASLAVKLKILQGGATLTRR